MARNKSTRPRSKRAPVPVHHHVEQQRRQLQKAAAVLLALVYALDRGLESEQASDAAGVALELVEQVVAALDSVNLNRQQQE